MQGSHITISEELHDVVAVRILTHVAPADHLAHRLFDILEVVDLGLLGLSEVGVIVFS